MLIRNAWLAICLMAICSLWLIVLTSCIIRKLLLLLPCLSIRNSMIWQFWHHDLIVRWNETHTTDLLLQKTSCYGSIGCELWKLLLIVVDFTWVSIIGSTRGGHPLMSFWVIGFWSYISRKTCVRALRHLVLVVLDAFHLNVTRSVNMLTWCCITVSSAWVSYWILVVTYVGCGSSAIGVDTAIRVRCGIDSSSVTGRSDATISVSCRLDVVWHGALAWHKWFVFRLHACVKLRVVWFKIGRNLSPKFEFRMSLVKSYSIVWDNSDDFYWFFALLTEGSTYFWQHFEEDSFLKIRGGFVYKNRHRYCIHILDVGFSKYCCNLLDDFSFCWILLEGYRVQ